MGRPSPDAAEPAMDRLIRKTIELGGTDEYKDHLSIVGFQFPPPAGELGRGFRPGSQDRRNRIVEFEIGQRLLGLVRGQGDEQTDLALDFFG
jgi:hypothetical protein